MGTRDFWFVSSLLCHGATMKRWSPRVDPVVIYIQTWPTSLAPQASVSYDRGEISLIYISIPIGRFELCKYYIKTIHSKKKKKIQTNSAKECAKQWVNNRRWRELYRGVWFHLQGRCSGERNPKFFEFVTRKGSIFWAEALKHEQQNPLYWRGSEWMNKIIVIIPFSEILAKCKPLTSLQKCRMFQNGQHEDWQMHYFWCCPLDSQ